MKPREFFNRLMEYPQPTRTEVLEAIENLTRNYDPDYTAALLSDLEDMLNEWKYNRVVARLEAEYNENILEPYNTALHCAEYALANGCNEPIEWPEEPAPFIAPPPFPRCYDDSLIYVAPLYRYAVEVLERRATDNYKSLTSDTPILSPKFETEQAQAIFDKLTANDYCRIEGSCYKWKKSTALLAYCIDEMSRILKLRRSNDRIPWSEFKIVFGLDKSAVNTCRNEVSKYTKMFKDKPEGWRELDPLLR